MRRAGDTEEFDRAFRELFVPAYRLAERLLGDHDDARDAAAEAMARALAQWGRVGRMDHRRAWVLRVTSNVAIDMLRKRRPLPDGDLVARELAAHVAAETDPDTRLAVSAALTRLPRRQAEVLVLRYVGDLSEDDIAVSLGVSPGTVKQHATRGLARLRKAFAESDAEPEAVDGPGLSEFSEIQGVHVAY